MSVDNHKHCQATVLGATGDPPGRGLTWNVIANDNLPNIDRIYPNWKNALFFNNKNMTQDLDGILKLINAASQPISFPSFPTFLEDDLISIDSRGDEESTTITIKVKNDFGPGYQGVVGVKGAGSARQLTECPIRVINTDEDGPVIATLWVGDQPFPIRALKVQEPEPEDRYVITEDREWDIVLSGGNNDGDPLDYTDGPERYVVTENGYEYDIGVSGYGDSVLLNYNED